ncbi:unnamed protein product [Lymnaea stagnalis]|uniref:Uncharacterized protein n=1 Tax=Lymnaea stagnalis TaxID=6523 RepID=A0AAV2IDJ9_LYMST
MASKTQVQRFIDIINQHFDILKREKKTVLEAVDDAINQVHIEVDAWVNGGLVNQTTCAQMNNRITQVINLIMTKSIEISDLQIKENESDLNQAPSANSNISIIPKTSYTKEEVNERAMFGREETQRTSGIDTSCITTARFVILEEAVLSLKKATEHIQEKQENVNKKLEILINANLKSKKKNQERITVLEKRNKEISLNVDDLFETTKNLDDKLKRLEDENKPVNVSMNELNKEISSVRTCSNDALMSIQDVSKSVESTNQHYNEMSDKMNQLEISINLMSTQYTEKIDNMERLNKDKVDDLIGMVCQLLSKRLAPLETLNETLNKKVILSKEHISKVEAIDTQLAEISGKVTLIERKFNQPTLLFNALKIVSSEKCTNIGGFDIVFTNNGDHFDPLSRTFTAPLSSFYLISIHVIKSTRESFKIRCLQKFIDMQFRCERTRQICCVSEKGCVTCLVELKATQKILLELEFLENKTICQMEIRFSCFMIKQ